MALPVMTPEQRADALAKAKLARKAKSDALASLRDGTVTLPDVLADKDSPLHRAFVRQVLLAVPGVGTVKADALMAELGIASRRRVAGLGAKQKAALVHKFEPVPA